jgi:RNA-binding protein
MTDFKEKRQRVTFSGSAGLFFMRKKEVTIWQKRRQRSQRARKRAAAGAELFVMDEHTLPIVGRIGKAGLTDSVIEEIRKQLKKRKIIKVKFLPSHASGKDKKQFAGELARKTGAIVVSQVGFVVVLKENLNTKSAQ